MRNSARLHFVLVLLCFSALRAAFAQPPQDALRLNELRRLRDQIALDQGLRHADALIVMNERAVAEAARQLIGLEIVMSNGSTIRVTSIESELKTAAALVKIGLQAKSSVTVNLQLSGRINSGELTKDALRLPVRVTEVKLGNGLFSSLLVKAMLGEWLKPETWNDELPAIELPLEFAETMQIPASKFEVAGELPMEIATPAFESPLKFSLTSLLALNKRAVLALRLDGNAASVIQASYAGSNHNNPAALESEIEELAKDLNGAGDLRIRIGRRVLSRMLGGIAAARKTDFDIHLKPGRVRVEEVSAIVNITNFTDVEGGQGRADVSDLAIERIADDALHVRLSGQGEVDARVKGREYGIPYSLSPHLTFAIQDQIVPLQFVSEGERVILRATPGAMFPIKVRISMTVAGRDLGINRTVAVDAGRWLNRIELPSFFGREIPLPQRVEVDADGNWSVTKQRKLNYTLANLRLSAGVDALEIVADVKLSTP
jgi:hypothetical protein